MKIKMFVSVFVLLSLQLLLHSYDKIDVIYYLEDSSLLNANYVHIDEKGGVYLLSGKKILKYTSDLKYETSLEIKGEEIASFDIKNDLIYVLDKKKASVNVLNFKGEVIFSFGEIGKDESNLFSPSDIRIWGDRVFIANTKNKRINVYDLNGIFLYEFPIKVGENYFEPTRISFDPDGNLYVIESENKYILKYKANGELLSSYQKNDLVIGITENGFVYGGGPDGKIREYDLSFNQKGIFAAKGRGKYEFLSFTDIKPYKNGIYVLDSKNKKILYLKIENKTSSYTKQEFIEKKNIEIKPLDSFNISALSFMVLNNDILYFVKEKGVFSKKNSSNPVIQYGNLESNLKNPVGMFYLDGKFYFLDAGFYKVKVFDKDFKYLSSFGDKVGIFGGDKDGRFSNPVSMIYDHNQKIYVLDSKLNMIQVFNKDGIFLYSIDLNTISSTKIKFNSFTTDNEYLYLVTGNKMYVISLSDGKLKTTFELKKLSEASFITYDGVKYLYTFDFNKSRIYVFDKNGNYITSLFGKGRGLRELYNPISMIVEKNHLYILDAFKISEYYLRYFAYSDISSLEFSSDTIKLMIDLKDYDIVEKLYLRKSTDGINFSEIEIPKKDSYIDKELIDDTTFYYSIKAVSISNDYAISQTKSMYIKIEKEEKKEESFKKDVSQSKVPVEVLTTDLKYIFSANYKYYTSNPLGKITVKNNTNKFIESIKVSFYIKEYMDFPFDVFVDSISPKSMYDIDIKATLNNKIITITENTPVQSQISLKYYIDGLEKELTINTPIKILSRDSIVWDDPRRIANFITVKDPLILAIVKNLIAKRDELKFDIDQNILNYALFLNYVKYEGLKYVEDPVIPYRIARSSSVIVDTILYPRNLLKMKSGDCDDFTTLFATFFEASGIRTVVMDYPQHITLMFEVKNKDINFIPSEFLIEYDNSYFIPIEVTMLSKSIYDSISYASKMYKENKDKVRFYDVRKSLEIYEPPTLDFKEETIIIPDDVMMSAKQDLAEFMQKSMEYFEKYYKSIILEDKDDIKSRLELGVLYSMNGKIDDAEKLFKEVLEIEPNEPSALNNLGNIKYLKKEYNKAIEYYLKASFVDPYDANILINIARSYTVLGKKEEARNFFNKAVSINPELKKYELDILK
jgi:tetratricopeptide (TPR) repeat protein/DNA-binding beta-propeller fold protein YncE